MTSSIACQQLIELITDYLEGVLTPAQLHAVEEHLSECDDCTEYLSQMRRVIALSANLHDTHPNSAGLPPGMLGDLLDAYRQRPPQP